MVNNYIEEVGRKEKHAIQINDMLLKKKCQDTLYI